MTAGNNGASPPEDDDPFGYLYEDGRAAGAVPPPGGGGYGYPGPSAGGQPGVPRTSYNHVRTVGERQYGQQQAPQQPPQQAPQQQYGQPQQQQYGQAQQEYGQPAPQRTAESYPGGPPGPQPPQPYGSSGGSRGGGRGGPQHKGLLIGAVAVVAVVVIGIAAALLSNGDDKKAPTAGADDGSGGGSTATQSVEPSESASKSAPAELPKQDAATLTLAGAATTSTDVQGAKASGGTYVVLAQPGDAATWTVKVPKAGAYTLSIDYGVPGTDAKTSLTVNDAAKPASVNMKNFAHAPAGDASKGWTNTYNFIHLKKGSNTIKISCEQGDKCGVNLDQLELKAGQQG